MKRLPMISLATLALVVVASAPLSALDSPKQTAPADIQIKREEIKQKITEKRAAIKEKLTDRRLGACQKKQTRINKILDNRVTSAERHLATFSKLQDRLMAFVVSKNLDVASSADLEAAMNDAKTTAQATIEATKETKFTCEGADATAPGKIVTEQVTAQKQALKSYLTAIKNYRVAIKGASTANKTEQSGEAAQ
jgi:hypothetical protein